MSIAILGDETILTQRQILLLENHKDTALFILDAQRQTLWVLDLEDRLGFRLAKDTPGLDVRNLTEARDSMVADGKIPAYTLSLPVAATQAILNMLGVDMTLRPENRYIVLVSSGCFSVTEL